MDRPRGGAALALLGVAAMWLREVPAKFASWAKYFLVTTLTVDSRDELAFPALVEYMDSRDALRRINNFTVRVEKIALSTFGRDKRPLEKLIGDAL